MVKASIEISLYPLQSDYKERITEFILRLREHQNIEVITNGMSTQIFGEYDELMDILKKELKPEMNDHRCMAVVKIGEGWMRPSTVPDELM